MGMSNNLPPVSVLVVAPAWIGDTIMSQVLFHYLKTVRHVLIDVLAPAWSHPLLQRMPEVRHTYVAPFRHGEVGLKKRYLLAKQLPTYDQAIILPNSLKSALVPFFAKIPIRTGWRREGRQCLLTDARTLDPLCYPRMIDQFLALAMPKNSEITTPIAVPKLQTYPENIPPLLKKFNCGLSEQRPLVILCPGAAFGSAKRWPVQHFSALASALLQKQYSVWLMGSTADSVFTEAINAATGFRCVDLAGRTLLSEAIDLLSLASCVVTNDSGLMHLAASLGRPLIALYGSSDPQFTPPLTTRAEIVREHLACQPCFERTCPLQHLHCLMNIKPTLVLSKIEQLLSLTFKQNEI